MSEALFDEYEFFEAVSAQQEDDAYDEYRRELEWVEYNQYMDKMHDWWSDNGSNEEDEDDRAPE